MIQPVQSGTGVPAAVPAVSINQAQTDTMLPGDTVDVGTASPAADDDQMIPVKLQLQPTAVEDVQTVSVPKAKLEDILNEKRFFVMGEDGKRFTEEEKQAILDGRMTEFNPKLNVSYHANDIVEMYEKHLGEKLEFPTKFYRHFLNETNNAQKQLETGVADERVKEKLEGFIRDLSRDENREDDSRVFLNRAASVDEIRMPSFNPARLAITLSPYPSKHDRISMMYPHRDTDCVAHEVGHLVHASIRPGWDESKYSFDSDFETCAFREGFGDLTSLFHALENRHTCEAVIAETGGNIRQSNRATRIAEDEGGDILGGYFKDTGVPANERFLRDIANDYRYTARENVEPLHIGEPNVGELRNDVYSYSQIFSGAVYDLVAALYEKAVAGGEDRVTALRAASDFTSSLLVRAAELAPWWKPDFKAMAACMLQADILDNGGKNADLIKQAFIGRNLLDEASAAEAEKQLQNVPPMRLGDLPEGSAGVLDQFSKSGLVRDSEKALCNQEKKYTNDRGETFVVYTLEKPTTADAAETPFDMSTAILGDICDLTPNLSDRSSLVLKFDRDGNLVYSRNEEYRTFDKAQHFLTLTKNPETPPA